MSDLRDLYQEVILDHGRHPRNFGVLAGANRDAVGHNPLCGDKLHLELKVEDGKVVDAAFQGEGCAISMASTSLMTEALKGKTEAEARALYEVFHAMATGEEIASGQMDLLDKLAIFEGVRDYPMRVKCATLPWHTLTAALDQDNETVVTE